MAASRPLKQYEFPTGFNTPFGPERYQIGEEFFWHTAKVVCLSPFVPKDKSHTGKGANAAPNNPKPIPPLITESLRACDPELRQVLMGNVVLTGGGSLFAGFADRLNSELARSFQHVRIFCCLFMLVSSSLVAGQNSCTREYRRAAIWRMAGG